MRIFNTKKILNALLFPKLKEIANTINSKYYNYKGQHRAKLVDELSEEPSINNSLEIEFFVEVDNVVKHRKGLWKPLGKRCGF